MCAPAAISLCRGSKRQPETKNKERTVSNEPRTRSAVSFSPSLVSVLDQLVEVLLHVLEDEEERLVLADDLLELHDVVVAQLLQRLPSIEDDRMIKHDQKRISQIDTAARQLGATWLVLVLN